MKISTEHIDNDSGHSPSDDDNRLGVKQGGFETLGHGELPPDPDAHLSSEERAAIVCSVDCQSPHSFILWLYMADKSCRTANWSGS